MKNINLILEVLDIKAASTAIIFKMKERQELEVLFHQLEKAKTAFNEKCTLDEALALKELVNLANKYPGISININDDVKLSYLIKFINEELEELNISA